MIKVALLSLLVVLLTGAAYLYVHLGVSSPVVISEGLRGPLILLSKNHFGAYHQIGPVIEEVERWALGRGLNCRMTFGEYLDDPAAVDQDRLRSRGGCVLTARTSESPPEAFELIERPERRYVIARFEGSPSIGPFKVYPKVEQYMQERRLKTSDAVIETYVIHGQGVTTEYLFPLE